MWGRIEKKNYRIITRFAIDGGVSGLEGFFLLDRLAGSNANDPE